MNRRLQTPGKMSTRFGGYLSDIDRFDAEFFDMAPRDAERLDPQHRLMLETAWEALEDAGLDPAATEGDRVGVFVGQWLADFEQRLFAHPEELDFSMTLGSGRYAASGRIAYAFNFTGPSMTLDTACSSLAGWPCTWPSRACVPASSASRWPAGSTSSSARTSTSPIRRAG